MRLLSSRWIRGRTLSFAVALAAAATISFGCGGGGGSPGSGNTSLVKLNTTSVAPGVTGVAYSQTFQADVPHAPGLFIVTGGSLPTGLTLNKQTGELSGYPRQTGTYHFEIAARDGVDQSVPANRDANFSEDRKSYVVNVGLGAPHILPQQPPGAQYRASYGYQIDVAGGTAPYTFAMTGGALPAGLSVGPTGMIGNFPTQVQVAPYDFDVTVTDAHGLTDTATLSVQVFVLPLSILTPSNLGGAAVNFPYDKTIVLASGGGGTPYTWSQVAPIAGETLLSTVGLTVSPIGHITDLGLGPTTVGNFLFTVRVIDEALQSATRQFSLTVKPGPVLTTISPNRGSSPGPFTVTGLNFQPGAQLLFKPGSGQSTVTPAFVSSTTLTFNAPVPVPSGGAGAVDVMVKNPDGGADTKVAAFVFPAAVIGFGTKGYVDSPLSSTGLDVAEVTGDGRADIIHCGASGMTPYSGAGTSTAGGLILLKSAGGSPPTFTATTLDTGNFYECKFVDVNSDGRLDIVGLGQSQIKTWINSPLGTFSAGPVSNLASGIVYPSCMAVGKLNSGSVWDIAVGVAHNPSYGFSNTNGRVDIMLGNNAGSFTLQDSANGTMPWQYGVVGMCCVDSDGDGRDEIAAGVGMGNYTSSPPLNYSATTTGGSFASWATKGTATSPPYYGSTTSVAAGDFLGTGQMCAISAHQSTYSTPARIFSLYSGPGLTTQTALPAPGAVMKSVCAVDADFDAKMDFAVSTVASGILVYKGSTQALVVTLDAASGSPGVSSPKTGHMASGDLDGDGKPDLVCTTSHWQVEEMAANYGSSYALGAFGNGGSMGIVFYLNTSN